VAGEREGRGKRKGKGQKRKNLGKIEGTKK